MPNRREFINCNVKAALALLTPAVDTHLWMQVRKEIKIGVITDLHQDIMHDAPKRLETFLGAMAKVKPDALLQLGDFAYPGEKNKDVIDGFNRAHEKVMHVIGNHDTDAGYTTAQCIAYWGMPGRYYHQMIGGISFLVLDGNEKGSPKHKGGYASYIGEEQLTWLKLELKKTANPVVVVSHQPLAGELAIDNALEVQQLLSAHAGKILLAINGHSHINASYHVSGVDYLHINSASYFWVGEKFKHESYPASVIDNHPWIAYTCPYRDALFASLVIDPETKTVRVEGTQSDWVGDSPKTLGFNGMPGLKRDMEIAPAISSRNFAQVR